MRASKNEDVLQRSANVILDRAYGRPSQVVADDAEYPLQLLMQHLEGDLVQKIELLNSFQSDQNSVQQGANEQRRRLHSLHLLPDGVDSADTCPICLSVLPEAPPTVQQLNDSLRRLEQELVFVSADQTEVAQVIARTNEELRKLDDAITSHRRDLYRMKQEDEQTRNLLERRNEAARVGGMIHMYMRVIGEKRGSDDNALRAEEAALEQAIDALEEEADYDAVQARTATFLGGIGQTITGWAREQQLEHSSGLLTFETRGPGLVSETDTETIPFNRFGSGRNWVRYHLLGHLGLHKWFVERDRPVPHFLILDQPSQVYFPGDQRGEGDEDMQEVLRIYHWLFERIADFDGQFQIIVMDHARFETDSAFMDHLRHDWWATDGALIPQSWLGPR